MIKPTTAVLLIIAFTAFAAAQNHEPRSIPRPAPEMQRVAKMLVGTWRVDLDYAPGGCMPKGEKGSAHSVIRLGPGGFSLIEDFEETYRPDVCTRLLVGQCGTALQDNGL